MAFFQILFQSLKPLECMIKVLFSLHCCRTNSSAHFLFTIFFSVPVQQKTCKFQDRSEAELGNTLRLDSSDTERYRKAFEAMIIDAIETFRNSTPAVHKTFVRKSRTETSTSVSVSYSKN